MINKDEKFIVYLNVTVNNVFKILPLYEEDNIGLDRYIESLLLELYSLKDVVDIKDYAEYISLLATLEAIKKEVKSKDSTKNVIKREVFKSINIIKNFIGNIKDGD